MSEVDLDKVHSMLLVVLDNQRAVQRLQMANDAMLEGIVKNQRLIQRLKASCDAVLSRIEDAIVPPDEQVTVPDIPSLLPPAEQNE